MKRGPDIGEGCVGILPAAGYGRRLQSLRGVDSVWRSKEVMPVAAFGSSARPVGAYLLDALADGGVRRAIWLIRPDKQDIPDTFAKQWRTLALEYREIDATPGVPFTIDMAYDDVRDSTCVLGWPDILFAPCDAYRRLLRALDESSADVVLGLFPTDQPAMVDVVELQGDQVRSVVPKPVVPPQSPLTWAPAVWKPAFTEYLHHALGDARSLPGGREPYLGDILAMAIEAGLDVRGILLDEQPSIDVGTPEGLRLLAS